MAWNALKSIGSIGNYQPFSKILKAPPSNRKSITNLTDIFNKGQRNWALIKLLKIIEVFCTFDFDLSDLGQLTLINFSNIIFMIFFFQPFQMLNWSSRSRFKVLGNTIKTLYLLFAINCLKFSNLSSFRISESYPTKPHYYAHLVHWIKWRTTRGVRIGDLAVFFHLAYLS